MRRDNKIIHAMWVGTHLSRLELLTLHSFVHFGHEFHLWAYDDLSKFDLPRGVVLRNAEEIIGREGVFAKSQLDPETGVGRGSFGAPFSDLFRYKLLQEQGGIWVDMDVTCLRPFDFPGPYAFRPHRVGVVGSILKCPPGSPLMRQVYEETACNVTPESDYLLPNRILSKHVEALNLKGYIVQEMSNPDSWLEYIRPMIEGFVDPPDEWYAIHWINEMWRTLQAEGGSYRGRRLLDYIPDKDLPRPGSTLWEMYRSYRLVDPWEGPPCSNILKRKFGSRSAPLPIRSVSDLPETPTHLNVLLPSLLRGGAERSVLETMRAMQGTNGLHQTLFVVYRSHQQYPPNSNGNLKIIFADDPSDFPRTMRAFALQMWESSRPLVYTHLIPVSQLRYLWDQEIATIPVVQNMSPSWTDPPSAYNDPHVPFIVGVSDAVSQELRASGVTKPVITLRHELQRFFLPEDLAQYRREIRERYGLSDSTFLIGMVGQFKSQKAYTRAVRVLYEVRRHLPAKLMILGGWDHEYGAGRAAYEATCRRAVELNVIADMITPGDIHPVEPYLAAFDVFLNTSLYEGLSVALLEALQTGCPVVTADAGGNREVLPPDAVVVADGSDIEAYCNGILKFVNRTERLLPNQPPDRLLVPEMWCLLAKHGIINSVAQIGKCSGTLFLIEDLQIGGPQTSLVNLLSKFPPEKRAFVCVLRGPPLGSHKLKLDEVQVSILSAEGIDGLPEKIQFVLNWIDVLNIANLCFWNVNPETKLVLAKVLCTRDIRMIDVSPGPMLFDELEACGSFQRRISFTAAQFFERLDAFVAKYDGGISQSLACMDRHKIHVIRNGVPKPARFIALPSPEHLLPRHLKSDFAIGTCCRIVPDKRLEFLIDMMKIVQERLPKSSLTIVGGPDSQSVEYFRDVLQYVEETEVRNVFFRGWQDDVRPFVAQFAVFVMVSERQGCPNSSLEAMGMGIPVVANRSGGLGEQIEDGVNGYLIDTPAEMAERVLMLLKKKKLREKMGREAATRVLDQFSLDLMVERYVEVLEGVSRGSPDRSALRAIE